MRKNVTILLLALMILSAGTAYAKLYNGYRQQYNNTLYCFNTTMPDAWKQSVINAANSWSNAGADFSFYNDSTSSNLWGTVNSGNNGIEALATCWVMPFTHIISKTEANFNTYYSFSTDGTNGNYDVESVALHEFGHWLSLMDDRDNSNSIMYYRDIGVIRALTQGDKNEIIAIYGRR